MKDITLDDIDKMPAGQSWSAKGDTPMFAICRAALKVVEGEERNEETSQDLEREIRTS